MKVWTNKKFSGHYPVGTAAVVVADTVEQAAEVLNDALETYGLSRTATPDQFEHLPTNRQTAMILCDGNY